MTIAVVIRMDPELRDALKARAEREDRSMAQEIRRALKAHVNEEGGS